MKNGIGKSFGFFAAGNLDTAQEFKNARMARSLPSNYPVLSAPIEHQDLVAIVAQANSGTALRLATVDTPSGPLVVLTMQAGTCQINWVADASDPELWAATDTWRKTGRAAFALNIPTGGEKGAVFGTIDFKIPCEIEEVRKGATTNGSSNVWDAISALAASDILKQEARSFFPGIAVNRVLVCALMTERIRAVVKDKPRSTKPFIVLNESSATAH
ncbi:hypothetical protein [Caballeronia sp. S22]|uniref:hypothetical protein n=1 Tax=Caballeronia sp. S22 TaxID=3137182 RepID=UPI0035316CBD